MKPPHFYGLKEIPMAAAKKAKKAAPKKAAKKK
jgi:hypothetical protein